MQKVYLSIHFCDKSCTFWYFFVLLATYATILLKPTKWLIYNIKDLTRRSFKIMSSIVPVNGIVFKRLRARKTPKYIPFKIYRKCILVSIFDFNNYLDCILFGVQVTSLSVGSTKAIYFSSISYKDLFPCLLLLPEWLDKHYSYYCSLNVCDISCQFHLPIPCFVVSYLT